MKTDIGACAPGDELATVLLLMRDRHCGWAPVVDGKGEVVGVITDRDAAMALLDHPSRSASRLTAREVMTRDVVGCGAGHRLRDVLGLMASHHVRRLPVLDERRHLAGVISIDDIVTVAGKRGAPTSDVVIDALRFIVSRPRAADQRTQAEGRFDGALSLAGRQRPRPARRPRTAPG